MIVSEKFIIGHIPKTGGHALAVMLSKIPNLDFESPFEIRNGVAHTVRDKKHLPLEYVDTTGRVVVYVIRRLPEWFLSIMVHQNLHYELNEKHRLKQIGKRQAYSKRMKLMDYPKFLPCELMCHTVYPDNKLKEFYVGNSIVWLRMENLADDLINLVEKYYTIPSSIKTEIRNLPKNQHSYKVRTPDLYWNHYSKEILYDNNPLWKSIEDIVY